MDGQVKVIEACGVDEGRQAEVRESRKTRGPHRSITHRGNGPGNNTSQTASGYMLWYPSSSLPMLSFTCQQFPPGQSPGKSHKLTTNSWLAASPKLSRPLLQGSTYQIIPNLQKATKKPVLSRTLPHHKALCSQLPSLSAVWEELSLPPGTC